jgi:hypothetical protein
MRPYPSQPALACRLGSHTELDAAQHGLANMTVQGIYPGMNNRKQGWAIVRRALAHSDGPQRLQVMRERCPNLIRTLPRDGA